MRKLKKLGYGTSSLLTLTISFFSSYSCKKVAEKPHEGPDRSGQAIHSGTKIETSINN
jgi:hypothetical protein